MPTNTVLALHALLDSRTEAAIAHLAEDVVAAGIGSPGWNQHVRPHMTMGSWYVERIDQDAVERMAAALGTLRSQPLRLRLTVSVRERIHLNLYPEVQHDLLAFHEKAHAVLGDDTPAKHQRDIDLPGQWIPHVSLFDCRDEDLPKAMGLVRRLEFPLETSIAGFALARYGGGQAPSVIVATARLAEPGTTGRQP